MSNLPSLNDIQKLVSGLRKVEGKVGFPTHLIASGEVKIGNQALPVETAIDIKQSYVQLSTNVGSLPNNSLGSCVTERLNRRLDGKFVNLESGKPDQVDLVYTTRQSGDGLNSTNFRSALEEHAKVTKLVQPILRTVNGLGHPNPQLDYPSIKDASQDIVDSHLSLDSRLRSKFDSVQYLPKS